MAAGACKVILCSYQEWDLPPPDPRLEECIRAACENAEIATALEGTSEGTFKTVIECLEAKPMSGKQQEFMVTTLFDLARPRKPLEPGA